MDEVSHGGLIKPSEEFKHKIKELELIFIHYVKEHFNLTTNVKAKLLMAAQNVNIDIVIKSFYFKIRIYFRINNLGLQIQNC